MHGADLVTVLAAKPDIVWLPDPAQLGPLAVLVAIYVRRFRRARKEAGGRGAGPQQAAFFVAGMLALLLALVSPIDALGEDYLFSAHMLQHVLLGDIAPALLLLSLSRVILRPVTKRLMFLEKALGRFASPWTGIGIWLCLMYLWHVPGMYDAALTHPVIHLVEHAAFFTAGLMVWWPIVQPVPMRQRLTGMQTLAYIATAKIGLAALGLYLTWSSGVLYSYYESVPRVWGLTAIGDQNTGGAIMMVEQSLTFVIALVFLFSRMLADSEVTEKRKEALEDRVAGAA